MFTGIIEEIGTIREINSRSLSINAATVLQDIKIGDSIAINGVCLTVNRMDAAYFTVDIMPETLRRTSFNSLHYGAAVNLERAMPAHGRFGGHFVQGHVDGIGRVRSLTPEGDALLMQISLEGGLDRYVVSKGFIAVDGVSLTVVHCDAAAFTVSLVTFTRNNTTLGKRRPGDSVNLEVDIVAKYLEKYSQHKTDAVLTGFLEGYGTSQ